MPRLQQLPDPDTVRAWKGAIDYYVWRGLPCARVWPRWTLAHRSQPVQAAESSFSTFALSLFSTGLVWHQQLPPPTPHIPNWTWRDLSTAAAYGTLYQPPAPTP